MATPETSSRLLLRPVLESDLPILYEQQLDREAVVMAAFPSRPYDAFMAHWARILVNPHGLIRAIVYDDQVVGNIVTWTQDGVHEVGYWLGKAYWGKGIATQALRAFLKIAVQRPLIAHVVKHNIGSIRVLQKCGFVIRGEQFGQPFENDEPLLEVLLELT